VFTSKLKKENYICEVPERNLTQATGYSEIFKLFLNFPGQLPVWFPYIFF